MDQTYDYKRFAILYVDDEEKSLKQLSRALSDTFKIYTAPNGEEGLKVLKEHLPEIGVIMSDQRMPGMKGVQLLEQARQLQPRIIRILATAYTDIEAAVSAVNTGAIYKYVSKPWDVSELEITLEHSLQFFVVQRERDALLREKLSVVHKMVITDRVLGLGVLAAGLGQRLRNSMSAIRTFLELTPEMLHRERVDLDRLQHPDFWQDFHQRVQERIKGLLEVLDGMSQFARPLEPTFQAEVQLNEVVAQQLALLQDRFQQQNITVTTGIPADLPLMQVDGDRFPRLIELLFREELTNLPAGARLDITAHAVPGTEAAPDAIELILRDNGPGLPHDALRSVFDPFFVRSDKPHEFGEYLMACFFIVHHHGGQIEVRTPEGGGLEIVIQLPVRQAAGPATESGGDFLARVMTNERLWEKLLTSS